MAVLIKFLFLHLLVVALAVSSTTAQETHKIYAARDNSEFPWFCVIYDSDSYSPFCYCTILSKKAVITAASCFNDKQPSNMHIQFGSIAANSMRKFAVVDLHKKEQDLVVLKTRQDMTGVQELELYKYDYFNMPYTMATLHSYGTSKPMKTHVHMVQSHYNRRNAVTKKTPSICISDNSHEFCVKESPDKKMPRCNIGLGTGVLTRKQLSEKDGWLLVGVATKSIKCDVQTKVPESSDIYTSVKHKLDWIKNSLK